MRMFNMKRYALEEDPGTLADPAEKPPEASHKPSGEEKEPEEGNPSVDSFASILEEHTALFLDEVRTEVDDVLDFSMENGFHYADAIPDEMKFDGVCSSGHQGTRFFDDLLGDCKYEVTVFVGPLRDSLAEFGVKAPKSPIPDAIRDDWDKYETLGQCEITLTLAVHSLNYIFKGNLKKGEITRQYWGE